MVVSPSARPEKIIFSTDLPKTRSGKIMRRLLRDVAVGRALGDVTTLADPSVIESLKARYAEDPSTGSGQARSESATRGRRPATGKS